jgi:hypothetical protein
VEQAASVATITNPTSHWSPFLMGLILLEALAAGLVFVLIIWWTMFSGRKKGELHDEDDTDASTDASTDAGHVTRDRNPPPKA